MIHHPVSHHLSSQCWLFPLTSTAVRWTTRTGASPPGWQWHDNITSNTLNFLLCRQISQVAFWISRFRILFWNSAHCQSLLEIKVILIKCQHMCNFEGLKTEALRFLQVCMFFSAATKTCFISCVLSTYWFKGAVTLYFRVNVGNERETEESLSQNWTCQLV